MMLLLPPRRPGTRWIAACLLGLVPACQIDADDDRLERAAEDEIRVDSPPQYDEPPMLSSTSARMVLENTAPQVCPTYATVGHYSVLSPQTGVTYTWDADGATVYGTGTSVNVLADSTRPFTLTVTATGPDEHGHMFEATFGAGSSRCWDEPLAL